MRDARPEGSAYPKADLSLRAAARMVDLALAFAVANAAREAGPPLAALYLLVADGLMHGQSVGKRLFGVRAMFIPRGQQRGAPAGYRESVLRNAPFALASVFYGLTLVGWVLLFAVSLPILAVEAYMAWSDRLGIRVGDIFADTQVVDAKVVSKIQVVVHDGDLAAAAPRQGTAADAALRTIEPPHRPAA